MSDVQTDIPTHRKRMPHRMSRAVAILLFFAVALVLGTWGVRVYLHASTHESTDDASVESSIVPMSPRVAGHVARVLVADNQAVHAGDLLVEIDPRDFEAALAAAEAAANAARSAVTEAEAKAAAAQSLREQAQADLVAQQAATAQVEADMDQTRAEYSRDKNDLQRMRNMAGSGAVSRQDLDHATALEAMTQAKLTSAKRLIDSYNAKISEAKASINAARDSQRQAQAQIVSRQADLRKAEAQTEQARLQLSYTRITAPRDGRVTKKNVEPGAYVQVGQGLFSLVCSDVWVVANFKETQLTRMQPGQRVEIEVDTYPGVHFHGHVDSIQQGTGSRFSLLPPENSSGNFIKVVQRIPVKIVFDKQDQVDAYALAPGMSVVPDVEVGASRSLPRVAAVPAKVTEQ